MMLFRRKRRSNKQNALQIGLSALRTERSWAKGGGRL